MIYFNSKKRVQSMDTISLEDIYNLESEAYLPRSEDYTTEHKMCQGQFLIYLDVISKEELLDLSERDSYGLRSVFDVYVNEFSKMTMAIVEPGDGYRNPKDFKIKNQIPYIPRRCTIKKINTLDIDYYEFFKNISSKCSRYQKIFDENNCFLMYGKSIDDMIRLVGILSDMDFLLVNFWDELEKFNADSHKTIIFSGLTLEDASPKQIMQLTKFGDKVHWKYGSDIIIPHNIKLVFLNDSISKPFDILDYAAQSFAVVNLQSDLPIPKHKYITI